MDNKRMFMVPVPNILVTRKKSGRLATDGQIKQSAGVLKELATAE